MHIIKSVKKRWTSFLMSKSLMRILDKVEYYTSGFMQIFLTERWWSISTFALPYLIIVALLDIYKYDAIRLYWRDDVVFAVMLIFTEVTLKFAYRHDKLKRGRKDIASIQNRRR